MDDALPVRVVERAGHVPRDTHGLFHPQLAGPPQPIPERLALHVGRDEVGEAAGHPGVEQRDDVGML